MQQTRNDPLDRERVRHGEHVIEHLMRRAGFGAGQDEIDDYMELGLTAAVRQLLDYESVPDDVDSLIGTPGYVATTSNGAFSPRTVINDSRQRWLFRMVHSDRPLQEKMTLFWHNHFATGYTKIAGALGATEATRYLAAKPSEDPARVTGQIEMLRAMEPYYRVWGKYDGRGLVIRSEERVEFHPDGKIVNVVPVASLAEAISFANVATQTVGLYPPERKAELRDALASAGVQRVVTLGSALGPGPGLPHDGFYPLQRFVRWVTDEGPTGSEEL